MTHPDCQSFNLLRETVAAKLDRLLARPMFFLSLLFLVLAAGLIHRVGSEPGEVTELEEHVIVRGLLLLWPIFVVDSVVRFWLRAGRQGFWTRLSTMLLMWLPPVRMAGRSYSDPSVLWLPWLGARQVDRHLRRTLERNFSVPMIIIALLVLPVLALEYFWAEEVRTHFGLGLFLDIGSSLIWTAFAMEFILMISVAGKKLSYCFQNWMDLAVVLLPLVEFLPILRLLRLTRVLQLQQLGNLGRLYRLRGLLLKLWRAVLVLEMLQRLFGNFREKRLRRLKELVAAKEEELADLCIEIAELERQVADEAKTKGPDKSAALM